MKSTELMIGDWVYVHHNGKAPHYGKVTALLASGAVETEINGSLSLSSSVEPIPLTTEILEKNGFKNGELNVSPQYFFEDGHIFIGVTLKATPDRQEGVTICKNINLLQYEGKIEFVHELQQAIRLCGIDKQITI